MKKARIKIKRNEEDNGMIILQKKLNLSERISQITNKNYTQKKLYIESNSSFQNEKKSSQYIPSNKDKALNDTNKDLYIFPSPSIDFIENSCEIYSKTLPNDLNDSNNNSKKKILFPKSNTINDVSLKQKNSSVETAHKRIYVHKKLQKLNTFTNNIHHNFQICKKQNSKDLNYDNTFYQSSNNKDHYSKLVVFKNKPKYFKKKQLTEIENISNGMSDKMKDIKYFESPITKKKGSYFKIAINDSGNKNSESEEKISKENDEYDIENKFEDEIDNGLEYRLDNLKDYINIYSINNNSDKKDEKDFNVYEYNNNNTSEKEEENKILVQKNDKNLFINNNKIDNLNQDKIDDKRNTININKNIIINKKIILIPEEKNIYNKNKSHNWSKTSYGFFNTYKKEINIPSSKYEDNYINKNNENHKKNVNRNAIRNDDNLPHSKTNQEIYNFVYQKKNFTSPTPKNSSNFVGSKTRNIFNLDLKKNNTITTEKSEEINKMFITEHNFYEPKKKSIISLKDHLPNQQFNTIVTENNIANNHIISKKRIANNIYNKLNISKQNQDNKNFTLNKNNDKNKNKESQNILIIENKAANLSILEKVKYLELQLKLIVTKITKYQVCEKECSELIRFYFENNYYQEKIQIIKNTKNKDDIKTYTKLEIIYLFICYDILCSKKFNKACIILKSIFNLLYDNFIVLLVLIIKNNRNEDKIIMKYLKKVIDEYEKNKKIRIKNLDETKIVEIIGNNSNEIINYYKMLIDSLYKKYYNEKDNSVKFPDCIKNMDIDKIESTKIKNVISSFFYETYIKAANYDFIEYKYFFYLLLSHKNNEINLKPKISKIKKQKINKDINQLKNYILPEIKNNYKNSLILDLDETLIYFQNKESFKIDIKSIILRPYLHEFLHDMKSIYELIIFSENTQEYVLPIIDLIQKKEKYFDYVICKPFISYDSDGHEIKDISLLGRDLKNIIVIDNIKQYYRSKENLICIKSFFGDINNDKKTLKLLGSVLKEIKIDSEKTGDIRTSISQLKYKLYPKVINTLD